MNAPAKPADVAQLPAMQTGGRVAAIVPASWQEITAIASAICRANMAPKSYVLNGVPQADKVAVAIMHGMEVGLTPMASLQSLAVINGMPGLYGDGLMAVVRASGQLEDLQEGLEVDDQGRPTIAWCKVKRKGEASWKERTLTYVECQRAGWTNKDGPWKLTPGRMMTVRVRGWLLRDMFADVLRGLHSAEELQDQAMVDVTPTGTATVAPAEPNKSDYVEKPKDPPPADPKVDPKATGKRGAKAKAGKDTGKAAPDAKLDAEATQREIAAAAGQVTDVEDLSEKDQPDAEPITFEVYKRIGDFFVFSDKWLEDPARTPDEARLWEAFYRDYIKEKGASPNKAIQEAIADTLGLYSAVLNKETQQ